MHIIVIFVGLIDDVFELFVEIFPINIALIIIFHIFKELVEVFLTFPIAFSYLDVFNILYKFLPTC